MKSYLHDLGDIKKEVSSEIEGLEIQAQKALSSKEKVANKIKNATDILLNESE
jgi:hypothetical protein